MLSKKTNKRIDNWMKKEELKGERKALEIVTIAVNNGIVYVSLDDGIEDSTCYETINRMMKSSINLEKHGNPKNLRYSFYLICPDKVTKI